jgi:hypothetical protein
VDFKANAGFGFGAIFRARAAIRNIHSGSSSAVSTEDAKLDYPLFGYSGTDSFDTFDIQTPQDFSWAFYEPQLCNYLRDAWSRRTLGDLGQPTARSGGLTFTSMEFIGAFSRSKNARRLPMPKVISAATGWSMMS